MARAGTAYLAVLTVAGLYGLGLLAWGLVLFLTEDATVDALSGALLMAAGSVLLVVPFFAALVHAVGNRIVAALEGR